jgi:alkylation response protein AidB-like acyl-CoA dehydrogenase
VSDYVSRARRIADTVLFPASIDVDRAGVVPESHFRLLADEGLYGVTVPADQGGGGISVPEFYEVAEILSSGCLATAFVWLQHHFVAATAVTTGNAAIRERWTSGLVSGALRAGVALAGAVPRPPRLWAKQVDGGYLLSGDSPFVSGWHSVDAVLVLARSADVDDTLVMGMIEPDTPGGPVAEPVHLVSAQGTDTVRLTFTDHFVPDTAVPGTMPLADFQAGQVYSARTNASVPLGITARCVRLLTDAGMAELAGSLTVELDAARDRLDAGLADGDLAGMQVARAGAAELAYRAAGAVIVAAGSAGITLSHHAQRLAREAMFTLVAAGRPEMKAELTHLFGTRRAPH